MSIRYKLRYKAEKPKSIVDLKESKKGITEKENRGGWTLQNKVDENGKEHKSSCRLRLDVSLGISWGNQNDGN